MLKSITVSFFLGSTEFESSALEPRSSAYLHIAEEGNGRQRRPECCPLYHRRVRDPSLDSNSLAMPLRPLIAPPATRTTRSAGGGIVSGIQDSNCETFHATRLVCLPGGGALQHRLHARFCTRTAGARAAAGFGERFIRSRLCHDDSARGRRLARLPRLPHRTSAVVRPLVRRHAGRRAELFSRWRWNDPRLRRSAELARWGVGPDRWNESIHAKGRATRWSILGGQSQPGTDGAHRPRKLARDDRFLIF